MKQERTNTCDAYVPYGVSSMHGLSSQKVEQMKCPSLRAFHETAFQPKQLEMPKKTTIHALSMSLILQETIFCCQTLLYLRNKDLLKSMCFDKCEKFLPSQ